MKVGISKFLNGVGEGVEQHVEKLDSQFSDLSKLLVARTIKLKIIEPKCQEVRIVEKVHLDEAKMHGSKEGRRWWWYRNREVMKVSKNSNISGNWWWWCRNEEEDKDGEGAGRCVEVDLFIYLFCYFNYQYLEICKVLFYPF